MLRDSAQRLAVKEASTIFLLAENRLLRESLSRLLRKKSDISVVGEYGSTVGAIQQVAESRCEILLLDDATTSRINPNLVVQILETVPGLKIILIGVDNNVESFLHAVRCGAVGYLLREASAMDVLAAVRAVARGEAVCPPQLTLSLFQYFAKQGRGVSYFRTRAELGLTRRQHQLVSFVAKGWTNKEIASTLNLSEQTVKNHMHRILRQVNAGDRYEAVETIRAFGLLS
jgi:two-component system, NarL family, nitrate/nitrite response regulator NarL